MTFRGHVKNGQIAFDEPVSLPEGAQVQVEVLAATKNGHGDGQSTIWEKLRSIAGSIEGPEDWARNHDHYIHGVPKLP